MKPAEVRALNELARFHGVETSYIDMSKKRRSASPESILAALRALGVPVARGADAGAALRESKERSWQRLVSPVVVAWDGFLSEIELRVPEPVAGGRVGCRLRLETGETQERICKLDHIPTAARARVGGQWFVAKRIPVNVRLPPGYHWFEVDTPFAPARAMIISAPVKSYSPGEPLREWGLFVPLYALHSRESWGNGDYGTLRQFVKWTGSLKGHLAATLPLLPAFLSEPFEPSPYAPASRLFWNEFYTDLSQVPELEHCEPARKLIQSTAFQRELERLRAEPQVNYRRGMALKRKVLQELAQFFFTHKSRRHAAFKKYLDRHQHVEDYAKFRAVCDRRKQVWQQWPVRLRDGHLQERDYAAEARQYHLYAQWLAHEQITAVSQAARRAHVRLYLDLPLGVHSGGYDAWREKELFALEATGGAPPDPVFTNGQDWGFAPLHPEKLREQHYHYMIDYLRHHLRQAGMLRIDHVMGLHRLFWIPRNCPACEGVYVRYRAEELYAVLSLESHRQEAIVVGENLGTVPPEVNESMARHGVREMFVVQYEQRSEPRAPFRPVPEKSVASFGTHDMPPFQAAWSGMDIPDRADLGLIKPREVEREKKRRKQLNQAMAAFLRRKRFLKSESDPAAVLRACLGFLASSRAEFLLINLEDLWLEAMPQNVPGTVTERVNWRRKTRFTLEEIFSSSEITELLAGIQNLRKQR
jgi:4-alpha-glucanotransferase